MDLQSALQPGGEPAHYMGYLVLQSDDDKRFVSDRFNIEPQHPDAGWKAFTDEEADALVYRLGNMNLMQAGINKHMGNNPYLAKRPALEQSGFTITHQLAVDHAEWTPNRIAAHQNWMASQATTI